MRRSCLGSLIKWGLIWTNVIVGLLLIGGYLYYSFRAGLVDIRCVEQMPEASILYDCRGYDYGRFFSENRISMPADKPVPKLLVEAVIDKEDRRFYTHGGVDWYGTARAAVSNILHVGARQGGSTITQQLARNSIGMLERTYDRKILEIFLANRIEQKYSKDDILRHYLDRIYFGQGLYGVETAAQSFFGKSVEKLNLQECALLSGIISSPNGSSPWKDMAAAQAARARALKCMVEAKHITQEQADSANKSPIALRPRPVFNGGFAAEEVRHQLEQIVDQDAIQQGGLKVFTTINSDLQRISEAAVAKTVAELEAKKGQAHPGGLVDPQTGQAYDNLLQGSFIAIDPYYGAVRAIVGSRDFATSSYDRALLSRRQVGSTLKPLIYAIALTEKGVNPATFIDATPFNLHKPSEGGPFDGGGFGGRKMIRINDAIVDSDNYAAMRMGLTIGLPALNSYAKNCGVTTELGPDASAFLGSSGLNLLELTEIYQTLANEGVWVRPHFIIEVRNSKDEVLYHYQPEARQVFTKEVARQVTGMMENVLDYGTGAPIRQEFHFRAPAAGKTGTTNEYKDCWFEGFTTHLVAGAWVGYDKPQEIMPGGYAARVALPIWARVMTQAKPLYKMEPFNVPADLQVAAYPSPTGLGPERYFLTYGQAQQISQNNTPQQTDQDDSDRRPGFFQRIINIFR